MSFALGCSDSKTQIDALEGNWKGMIIEEEQTSTIRLTFTKNRDQLSGEITLMKHIGLKSDIKEGTVLPIVNLEKKGNRIEFVIPMFGEVNEESVYFDLKLSEDDLVGYGHELREESKKLPVKFSRQP